MHLDSAVIPGSVDGLHSQRNARTDRPGGDEERPWAVPVVPIELNQLGVHHCLRRLTCRTLKGQFKKRAPFD
jgi:hypothetical protein